MNSCQLNEDHMEIIGWKKAIEIDDMKTVQLST